MKRILTNLLMAAAMVAPFVTTLTAQTNREVVDIPFSFVLSNRTMPAGKYTVDRFAASQPSIFTLTGPQRHVIVLSLGTLEKGNPGHPSLTFACLDGTCVLAKVTPFWGDTAYALSKNSIERQLPRHLAVVSMISVKATRK